MLDMNGREIPADARLIYTFPTEGEMIVWLERFEIIKGSYWCVRDSDSAEPYEVWA